MCTDPNLRDALRYRNLRRNLDRFQVIYLEPVKNSTTDTQHHRMVTGATLDHLVDRELREGLQD